jgi:catechol 2,3-dioxygenase-like lactoylglutathione lyase family enzyme
VLHHVSLEVDPAQVEACVACWKLLGFEPIETPEELGGYVTWLERAGTQIHLIHAESAAIPPLGHTAVAVEDFDSTFAALEGAGHEPERHRELWGEPRAFVKMPGGHLVEFMAAPPPSRSA